MKNLSTGMGIAAALLGLGAVLLGGLALAWTPVVASGHDCPTRPLPASIQDLCRACPTVVDPVTCTIACQGGPRQQTYTNQCFASCSGNIFLDDCQRTGS